PAQPAGDLFGRPLLGAQQGLHLLPQPGPGLGPGRLGPSGGLVGPCLGGTGAIGLPAPVGFDLPADGAPVAADAPPDVGVGLAGFDADADLLAVFEGEIPGSRLAVAQHDHTVFTDPPSQGGYADAGLGRG